MSRVSIDDIAKLFGMTPGEALDILRKNRIADDSFGNRFLGYRFGSDNLESVGEALRSARNGTESVTEIEVADIERVTDLPHATVCEAYGLPEDTHMLPVTVFHEGVEAVAQLRWQRRRAAEIKWQNDANSAHRERDAVKKEVTTKNQRLHELEGALEAEKTHSSKEEKRVASLEKRLSDVNAALVDKDKEIGDKERAINRKERNIKSLQDQLSALRSESQQSKEELRRCQNDLEQNRSELLEQASRLDDASQIISELEAQLERLHQPQLSQESRDELNALKKRAVKFWNLWLDTDQAVNNRITYTVQNLAQVLSIRQEAASKTLFGTFGTGVPSYNQLRENTGLLRLMKQLGFGNDRHPEGYASPGVVAYYTLRYELSYAFEYYEIYRGVLQNLVSGSDLSVLSVGCGQGLDYWGLRCAQAALNRQNVRVRWHGIDLESWPESVLYDDTTYYEYDTDLLDFIAREDVLSPTVVMLPKTISELPMAMIEHFAEWLERAKFMQPVHYLCIVHTKRSKLNGLFEYDADGFEKQDAVKSAKLIGAFTRGAERQDYTCQDSICPGVADVNEGANAPKLTCRQYRVRWAKGVKPIPYKYVAYESSSSSRVVVVNGVRPFDAGMQIGRNVHDIGKECCPDYVAINKGVCVSQGTLESCPKQCPLYRWPRSRTDEMAYQIIRIERPLPKHFASSVPGVPKLASSTDFDKDIPF